MMIKPDTRTRVLAYVDDIDAHNYGAGRRARMFDNFLETLTAPVDAIRLLERSGITPDSPRPDLREARELQARIRYAAGFKRTPTALVVFGGNIKLDLAPVRSYGVTLAQASTSGVCNVCRWSTVGCRAGCVLQNGHGGRATVQRARIARTWLLYLHPVAFYAIMEHETAAAARTCERLGEPGVLRANVASDVPHERYTRALTASPWLLPYDYTKAPERQRPNVDGYALVRSIGEHHTTADIRRIALAGGRPVVIVDVSTKKADGAYIETMPPTFAGIPAIDGDLSDDHTKTPRGVVILLRGKGRPHVVAAMRSCGFMRAPVAA